MTGSRTRAPIRPLRPKHYSRIYPKMLGVRPDYGQRRRDREIARSPLFAELPGWIETAETYERRMAEGNALFVQQQRRRFAAGWWRVRRWLDVATPTDVDEFFRRWAYLPHAPEYLLDAITQIDRHR
jgi:hypothetical protein